MLQKFPILTVFIDSREPIEDETHRVDRSNI